MHTAEASPEDSRVDLSAPKLRVCRDTVRRADPTVPSDRHHDRMPVNERSVEHSLRKLAPEATASLSTSENSEIPTWKRVLDIGLIVLTLPMWFPIFLVIALWVKIVSPGPVFFRQERIGFLGKRFMLLKFRTMKVNVETGVHEQYLEKLINSNVPMTKLDSKGDLRIIAGGRIIRATGLDELPQLLNVLRGEMSLVGPRPCTPKEFKHYTASQLERVNALPGLTGYWQVNGKNKTTFSEMIEMDIFYTKNLTLWLDLQIIVRTFPAIIAQILESRVAARLRPQPAKADRASGASTART